jgi:hypothetical protein
MLSNDAIKLLKWFEKHDEWKTSDEIQKSLNTFDSRDLKALKDKKMLDYQMNLDEGDWSQYRINDAGKAYLQNLRAQRLPELRDWINALLPVLTFLGGLLLSDPVKKFFRWLFDLFS